MKLVSLNNSDGTKLGTEREIRLIGKVFCQDNFNKKKKNGYESSTKYLF